MNEYLKEQDTICTAHAAVTSSTLDRRVESSSEYLFDEKFQPKISTQQKILCYYAGLI
jgi:hypothetical protein